MNSQWRVVLVAKGVSHLLLPLSQCPSPPARALLLCTLTHTTLPPSMPLSADRRPPPPRVDCHCLLPNNLLCSLFSVIPSHGNDLSPYTLTSPASLPFACLSLPLSSQVV